LSHATGQKIVFKKMQKKQKHFLSCVLRLAHPRGKNPVFKNSQKMSKEHSKF
jgi:hypothetical protein